MTASSPGKYVYMILVYYNGFKNTICLYGLLTYSSANAMASFLSSNSYALAQLGWSTVLVEPNPSMMALAQRSQVNMFI